MPISRVVIVRMVSLMTPPIAPAKNSVMNGSAVFP